MKIKRIGVDIAKSVFHVHGVDRHGKLLWQRKLKRSEWISAICEKAEPGVNKPCSLHKSGTLAPFSFCFKNPSIWLSVNRDFLIEISVGQWLRGGY